MAAITKILVPTDFSELSLRAVDEAAGLAATLNAELHLVHVCPLLVYAIAKNATPDSPDFEPELKARLGKELEALAEKLRGRGIRVETALVEGNPNRVIAELAAQRGCDLIAMGTHGRSGVERWTLGSVAERTVRVSPVPVLTLRAQA